MSTALTVRIAAPRGASSTRRAPGFVRSLPRAAATRCLPRVVCAAVEPAAPGTSTSTGSTVAAQPVQTVAVTFKCFLKVRFGEHVRVVGSTAQLGSWKADKGPELKWSEGDVWTGTAELPVGEAVEFKFVHMLNGGRVSWENLTSNRSFTAAAGRVQSVTTQWNNPMADFEAVAKPITSTEALELLDTPLFSTVLVPGEADELAAAGASGAGAASSKAAASTVAAQPTAAAPAAAAPAPESKAAEGKPAEGGPAGFGSMDQRGGSSVRKQAKKQQKKRFRFMN